MWEVKKTNRGHEMQTGRSGRHRNTDGEKRKGSRGVTHLHLQGGYGQDRVLLSSVEEPVLLVVPHHTLQ